MSEMRAKLYELPELLAVNGGPIPCSRAHIYNAAKRGDIPTVKVGKRLFVPWWFVEGLLKEPTGLVQTV